jgi:myo-inositol-1(or 4)-monophosphatase
MIRCRLMSLSNDEIPSNVLISVATDAAHQAGAVLAECARTGFSIRQKQIINLVTDADHQAEQRIIDVIHDAFPAHRILAEERGLTEQSPSRYKWVIDPLDGTTNFAHGFPSYCVSIGVECDGRMIVGVVYDPTRDEMFTAQIGHGACLNGAPISVSKTNNLDCALLVTGFAYDIRETPNNNLNHFVKFALKVQGLRRTGTAALDLCYVAAGRFDGFWEVTLNSWDMAAGVIILRESGGKVTDFKGAPHSIYRRELVASNGVIHQAMLDLLREDS